MNEKQLLRILTDEGKETYIHIHMLPKGARRIVGQLDLVVTYVDYRKETLVLAWRALDCCFFSLEPRCY
jgi:hypothetical protein